jgi:hypothetical protein
VHTLGILYQEARRNPGLTPPTRASSRGRGEVREPDWLLLTGPRAEGGARPAGAELPVGRPPGVCRGNGCSAGAAAPGAGKTSSRSARGRPFPPLPARDRTPSGEAESSLSSRVGFRAAVSRRRNMALVGNRVELEADEVGEMGSVGTGVRTRAREGWRTPPRRRGPAPLVPGPRLASSDP